MRSRRSSRSPARLAALLGGSIPVETIFTLPGMGQYLFESVRRAYPAIQAIVLVAAAIVLIGQRAGRPATRADARVSDG